MELSKMWKDFKAFAFKGNVMDLAVAVVIGAAFGKIVSSLVENIITPVIVAISGKVDLTGMQQNIFGAEITYGAFLQSIIDFLIVAVVIFMVVRVLSKLQKKEEVVAEEVIEELNAQEVLLTEIRDLLKEGKTL